jgi:hypothetical protein
MSELITVKVPDGTKAKLKAINRNVSELVRQQVERLLKGEAAGSAYDKAAHLIGSVPMPADASTSKDYLKQYGQENSD